MLSKRQLHQILRARANRHAHAIPRQAYATFPRGRWDISGERRTAA